MPRKYPDETKQKADSMLQIHHAIPIPPDSLSTLSVLSEKVFSLSANGQRRIKFKPKPNRRQDSLMTKYCRHPRDIAAARQMDGGTPPRIHTVSIHYAKTRVFYGHFMCILRAFARTFAPRPTISVAGLCRRAMSTCPTRPTRPSVVKKFEAIALHSPVTRLLQLCRSALVSFAWKFSCAMIPS